MKPSNINIWPTLVTTIPGIELQGHEKAGILTLVQECSGSERMEANEKCVFLQMHSP
jgi:hypothetical protein